MASNKDSGFSVLIPYKELETLLEAPKKVRELEKEITHNRRMIGALRGQLYEVMEKLREK